MTTFAIRAVAECFSFALDSQFLIFEDKTRQFVMMWPKCPFFSLSVSEKPPTVKTINMASSSTDTNLFRLKVE